MIFSSAGSASITFPPISTIISSSFFTIFFPIPLLRYSSSPMKYPISKISLSLSTVYSIVFRYIFPLEITIHIKTKPYGFFITINDKVFHIMVLGISVDYLVKPSLPIFFAVRTQPFINVSFIQPFAEKIYNIVQQRF